jgi:hypothetical protein
VDKGVVCTNDWHYLDNLLLSLRVFYGFLWLGSLRSLASVLFFLVLKILLALFVDRSARLGHRI